VLSTPYKSRRHSRCHGVKICMGSKVEKTKLERTEREGETMKGGGERSGIVKCVCVFMQTYR
ncbi:MAG: hypothetical protein ACRC4N_17810, partial [Gammaproteobacteria bacterium]